MKVKVASAILAASTQIVMKHWADQFAPAQLDTPEIH